MDGWMDGWMDGLPAKAVETRLVEPGFCFIAVCLSEVARQFAGSRGQPLFHAWFKSLRRFCVVCWPWTEERRRRRRKRMSSSSSNSSSATAAADKTARTVKKPATPEE